MMINIILVDLAVIILSFAIFVVSICLKIIIERLSAMEEYLENLRKLDEDE